ncbi:MAG: DUF1517 domain-containing protein [Alkalinema sp. RU_4_3]|nr:DUF1517 domain-containing protein [Alkalinema sp. RU_4_3]
MSLRDSFNSLTGKSRFVVSRLFIQLSGTGMGPLWGQLQQFQVEANRSDGDLNVMGEGLVSLCEALSRRSIEWTAAANEGEVFWDEGEAADYINELFMDSASRYVLEEDEEPNGDQSTLTLSGVQTIVVSIAWAYIGAIPDLEANLAEVEALKRALIALPNLHFSHQLEALQVHFCPVRPEHPLSPDQLLEYFPELSPI